MFPSLNVTSTSTFDFSFSQNAMLPAGLRQRDQTKKSPTGPFDREALQQHLEKLALEHEDREDLVPFTGEKKGGGAGVLSEELY